MGQDESKDGEGANLWAGNKSSKESEKPKQEGIWLSDVHQEFAEKRCF